MVSDDKRRETTHKISVLKKSKSKDISTFSDQPTPKILRTSSSKKLHKSPRLEIAIVNLKDMNLSRLMSGDDKKIQHFGLKVEET